VQLLATGVVGATISWVLQIYILVLIARIVVDYVFMFARDWRPQGVALVIVELVYTVTDPPIRLLSRIIPSIRVGQFDFQLTVVFLILFIGINILISMARLYL
jgi:YggT family protein